MCSDLQCTFHEPLTSEQEISDFPDLILYEENGIEHYKMGSNSEEKCMPLLLLDSSKCPDNIPFSPTVQKAKSAGLTVKCDECKRPHVIHSKNKLKQTEVNHLKRALNGQQYICGSVFSKFDREEHAGILSNIFVQENLSCMVEIEFIYFSPAIYPVCANMWSETKPSPKEYRNISSLPCFGLPQERGCY